MIACRERCSTDGHPNPISASAMFDRKIGSGQRSRQDGVDLATGHRPALEQTVSWRKHQTAIFIEQRTCLSFCVIQESLYRSGRDANQTRKPQRLFIVVDGAEKQRRL
jgi:hypothetical protein